MSKRNKDIFPKRKCTWKDAWYHLSSGKSKPQWDITSNLSEWLSLKRTQISIAKDAEKGESSYSVAGECKLVQPLWKTVWRPLKKLRIPLLEIQTEREKKTTLILKAHSSIIENCQDGTWQPKCPWVRWMHKEDVVCVHKYMCVCLCVHTHIYIHTH